MLILVNKPPLGEAPEWVREAWVGKTVFVLGPAKKTTGYGVVSGNPVEMEGYSAYGKMAIDKLEEKAAQWWKDNCPHIFHYNSRLLLFDEDCCKLLT